MEARHAIAASAPGLGTHPFRDPTSRSISCRFGNRGMEPNPTCRTCGALVDLTRRNAVTQVIYRNVSCRGCGVICILEGPERNVNDLPAQVGRVSSSKEV